MYYVYLLRCQDDSLYCGITSDIEKRIVDHNSNSQKGAKYTRSRQPVILVYHEKCATKQIALKREIAIKKFSKKEKEALIDKRKIRFTPNIKILQ